MKRKSCRTAIDRTAAQVVHWWSSWQRHGEGNNPELYEQGYDNHKREPSRTPRPEKRLNFDGE